MADKLRFVGICASPRKKANTQILVEAALDAAAQAAHSMSFSSKVELVLLAQRQISPCLGCDACATLRSPCVIRDDWHEAVRPLIDPIPDGVIFGSPVYFFNQNALGRAYMERCTSLLKKLWDPEFPTPLPDWSATAAGAVAVGFDRNGGVEFALTSILQWFLTMGFVTVGGFYIGGAGWTQLHPSRNAVLQDEHGMEAARLVGRRVAKAAALLHSGKVALRDRGEIDTSWMSMQVPLVKGGDN